MPNHFKEYQQDPADLQIIGTSAKHSAFTDLCFWQNHLYCCFREATDHISPDGRIKILKLKLNGEIIGYSIIQHPLCDLRDPKLTVDDRGRLSLIIYRKQFDKKGQLLSNHPMSFFSTTGASWSSGKLIGHRGWWLWRLRWHHKHNNINSSVHSKAYGFAYNRSQQSISVYSGHPNQVMELHNEKILGQETHQLGYPNESDIVFQDNHAWSVVRRDADSCTAQLGYSVFPFKRWQWQDLGIYLGGPCMIKKNETEYWLAGRIWENQKFNTRIYRLTPETKQLQTFCDLPSGGDNSYPGLVQYKNRLYVSYYSSHIDQKSQIYLATFELED